MERRQLRQALVLLLGSGEPEIGCDECFAKIDEYVEFELAGADANAAVPGLHTHLVGCPACREEYETLRALLRSDAQP